MQTRTHIHLNMDLIRPRLVMGCEPAAFTALCFGVVFVLVVVFGLTLAGVIAAMILTAVGISLLRRIAAYDPMYFMVLWTAMKYPGVLPRVMPHSLGRLDFLSYGAFKGAAHGGKRR